MLWHVKYHVPNEKGVSGKITRNKLSEWSLLNGGHLPAKEDTSKT